MEAFLVSTASVAVGELGDKTQLLSLILASRLRRPVPIIAGIFVATLGNHLLACWFGEWVGNLITPRILRWGAGHLLRRRRDLGSDSPTGWMTSSTAAVPTACSSLRS